MLEISLGWLSPGQDSEVTRTKGPRKSVRFTALTQRVGQPSLAMLWGNPKKDRSFMRLVEADRVATLLPGESGKSEHAIPGFEIQAGASYLLFPKPLKLAADTTIVGIKHELIQSDAELSFGTLPKPKRSFHRGHPATVVPAAERNFTAQVTRSFQQTVTVKVTARDKKSARKRVIEELKRMTTPSGMRLAGESIETIDEE